MEGVADLSKFLGMAESVYSDNIPTFPTMPMPASAACIMLTSLPPSPTAATRAGRWYFFINATIWAFCSGEHRQQTTAGQFEAKSANSSSYSSRQIYGNEGDTEKPNDNRQKLTCTIMPILLFSDVKGNKCKILKATTSPVGDFSCMPCRSRCINFTPTQSAHETKATWKKTNNPNGKKNDLFPGKNQYTSSGDDA
uniref:Uncharacterized protein n=1 Tax=Romanomermis culicivorax TaxID=13658 RepID=A0A915HQB4_ROMCU